MRIKQQKNYFCLFRKKIIPKNFEKKLVNIFIKI